MRKIQLVFFLIALSVFFGCVKSKNDWAGVRNDDGNVVISILEDEYIDQDNHVVGFGYMPFAHFDFGGADEPVKFFTVHIAQPRNKKINGSLKLTITAANGSGDPLPAGAITIPSDISIPAFDGDSKDIPILFTVKKAGLDPSNYYSVVFTITSADQGVVSSNASQIEVFLYPGKYFGRYMVESTVTDPLGFLQIQQNTKPVLLDDLGLTYGRPAAIDDPNYLSLIDEYYVALGGGGTGRAIQVDNLTSGVTAPRYALLYPTYHISSTGAVDGVFNTLTGANYNVTFTNDLPNKIVINNNGDRTLQVSYNITLTAPVSGGGTQSRIFHVQEKYSYHPVQVRIFY